MDLFTELFDIRIAFIADDGREIRTGKSKPLCNYCRMVREDLGFEESCTELDKSKHSAAIKTGETVTYVCYAGLYESITPVVTDHTFVGYLTIGQFRTPKLRIPKAIEKKWDELNGTDELRLAYEETPCFEQERAESIIKLFGILVDYINQQRIIEIYEEDSLRALIDFMHNHSGEILELADGARIARQSPSALSQKFKKIMGKSFKQYQINLKLEKAEALFRAKPEMTVSEVASELGYKDPYYFSRLYKKHRGCAPSDAKKTLLKEKRDSSEIL